MNGYLALRERYHDLRIIPVEDALYANSPHISQITDYGWRYVLNVKPESHPRLERQFAGRRASEQAGETQRVDPDGVKHYYGWTNDLYLCESATDVKVNYLLYEQTDRRGKVTRYLIWRLERRCQELSDTAPDFRSSLRYGSRQGALPATRLASQALDRRLASAGGLLRRACALLAL